MQRPLLPQANRDADSERGQRDTFTTVFPPLLFRPSLLTLLIVGLCMYLLVHIFGSLKAGLEAEGARSDPLSVYVSIPVVSVIFTYIHIWAALFLTFFPLEFIGCCQIPGTNVGLGWQGIIPHKAEKMARISVRLLANKVLSVHDIFTNINAAKVARELKPALTRLIPYVVNESAEEEHLSRWRFLPSRRKNKYTNRAVDDVGPIVEGIMEEMTQTIEEVFDLEDMVVTALTTNPALLNHIFINAGYRELELIRNNGAVMGGFFGILQVMLWCYCSEGYTLPIFGGVVGFITNWCALKVIFSPIDPVSVCGGTVVLQGMFLKRQDEVSAMYGKLVAKHVLSAENILTSVISGPKSDRFFDLIQRHVDQACNRAVGGVKPLIKVTGRRRFNAFKTRIASTILASLEVTLPNLEGYMNNAMDLERYLTEAMRKMPAADFEQLLHPVFQEDEWKLLLMGGLLGVAVGFCQWQALGQ